MSTTLTNTQLAADVRLVATFFGGELRRSLLEAARRLEAMDQNNDANKEKQP